MLVFPHAKINLGLNITEKRVDGLHTISSVLFPIPLCDALEIIPNDTFEFHSSGLEIPGTYNENLVYKAWILLHEKHKIGPVKVHLHKVIPMGAGLGGGSSDAAFTLMALNHTFDLGLSQPHLHQTASVLGADCPFFLYQQPMIVSGTGTVMKPFDISLKDWYVLLVFPDIHSSTREAYQLITPTIPEQSIQTALMSTPESWRDTLKNDFESSVFERFPLLDEIKLKLYKHGAVYAAMSGSGSSLFGLFETKPKPLNLSSIDQSIFKIQ